MIVYKNIVTFTRREEQILTLLANYHTHTEMCSILRLNKGTLEQHIANIRRKINRTGIKLVKFAVEHGYGKKDLYATEALSHRS